MISDHAKALECARIIVGWAPACPATDVGNTVFFLEPRQQAKR
jgi:hypothetical protein